MLTMQFFQKVSPEKIPSHMEVLNLAGNENQTRKQFGLRNLVINIELKGKGAAVKTGDVVAQAIEFFKTDEPAKVRKIMDQRAAEREKLKSFVLGKEDQETLCRLIKPGTADLVAKELEKSKEGKKPE